MSDLTGFLLARVAEDEAVARAANEQHPSPWLHPEFGGIEDANEGRLFAYDSGYSATEIDAGVSAHVTTFHPARVLAECEAKRRIVAMLERWAEVAGRTAEESADDAWIAQAQVDALEPVIATLARVYADHPDFRPEWSSDSPG